MALYKDILGQLGSTIGEYNNGAWVLFRNQITAEINSNYIFSNGVKPDESLLSYSLPFIESTNKKVKGVLRNKSRDPKFTYYTSDGPETSLKSNPSLQEPDIDVLKIDSDFKVNLQEGTRDRISGNIVNQMYDEENLFPWTDSLPIDGGIGKELYDADITTYNNGETLLSKTKLWFQNKTNDYISKRFKTLISRFHGSNGTDDIESLKNNVGVQAFSKKYGLSHGRNLLRKNIEDNPGVYEDPYCRVWTWHKQYNKLVEHNIRPLKDDNGYAITQKSLNDDYGWNVFRSVKNENFEDGGNRLANYGVMYDNNGSTNGLVNITPSYDKDAVSYEDSKNVSVEHCMFSIENLAWKGTYGDWDETTEEYGLSREQKGPLGGRIMWFPPYGLSFNESIAANWQTNDFIGRGEPIYTYANTTRSGTLNFKLLIDHPSILDYWERRSEVGSATQSGVDDVDSKEQEMLRFFAGCSILKASDPNKQKNKKEQTDKSKNNKNDRLVNVSNSQGESIRFFVFFPNNYTGKTDRNSSAVNPIDYLMNGVGTNMMHVVGEYGENSVDFATDPSVKLYQYGNNTQQVGGYEMRNGIGISVIKTNTNNNHIVDIHINDNEEKIEIVKIIGSKAEKSLTGTTESWNKRRYYYRCDKTDDIENQIFVGSGDNGAVSYIDKDSYQFNSINYQNAVNMLTSNDNSTYYSFCEVYIALNGDKSGVFSGLYDEKRVDELKKIFNGEKGEITEILTSGYASLQGNNTESSTNTTRNAYLANERMQTINKWLSSSLKNENIKFHKSDLSSLFGEEIANKYMNMTEDPNDSNSKNAKLKRFVLVEIRYNSEKIENASETVNALNSNVMVEESNEKTIESNNNNQEVAPTNNVYRYDNEARFFNKLVENEPFMAKLLSERIKNFDPVFHSMSPEGFNARLTFLHQCMRQGPTYSSSDTNGFNANNLSFGRPPVCVLRVGDFYNTKIIIKSLNIDYDPLVWDLNQEGIGVMPMIANISIGFDFIGGSDLGGPIQRLQNATSFNYYANAGVYDNRSEMINYNKGNYSEFKASPM